MLELLKKLVEIDGIEWIRLLYVYPENITDEMVEFLATNPKIVKYLDIPVQHASNRLLEKMNRDVTKEQIASTIGNLRSKIPEMAIRTSVMVGFPGETDADVDEMIEFLQEMKFDHLGCFTYSQEEGTVAGRMKDQIDEDAKVERQSRVMEAQKKLSNKNLQKFVGRKIPVLVKGVSEESDLLLRVECRYRRQRLMVSFT